MTRYCDDCGAELIHHNGSSNWECSSGECPVSFIELRRLTAGKEITYEVKRVVYATVI